MILTKYFLLPQTFFCAVNSDALCMKRTFLGKPPAFSVTHVHVLLMGLS